MLEKDRTRRYETANGLAMDIQRHLNNEPVVARPPSNLYRFQKLVRRNKLAFAAGAVVLLVLLGRHRREHLAGDSRRDARGAGTSPGSACKRKPTRRKRNPKPPRASKSRSS